MNWYREARERLRAGSFVLVSRSGLPRSSQLHTLPPRRDADATPSPDESLDANEDPRLKDIAAFYPRAVTQTVPRSTWRATLLVALSACGFGSITVLMVLGHRNGLTLAGAMAWRYLLATPFLLVIAGDGLRDLSLRRAGVLFVAGGLGQVAISGISLYTLRWLDVATLAFLFYTFPAWVAVISVLRGLERVDARRSTALALALGGLFVIIGAPRGSALPAAGVACALGVAVIYAAYIPLLHWMRGPLTAAAASALVIAGAGTVYLAGALWRGEFHVGLTPVAWGIVGTLAIGSTVVSVGD